jgi:predicted PurR-regulated permease PerM
MEAVYFALTAIVLYFVSDWVLDRIERAYGRRFEHRTLIFFAILLVLALASFAFIRRLAEQ